MRPADRSRLQEPLLRLPDPDEVLGSYASLLPRTVVWLFDAPPPGPVVHVITAWNPQGRPTGLSENAARHAALDAQVQAGGWTRVLATVFDDRGEWAEQALGVYGAPEEAVVALAAEFGQRCLLRLDGGADDASLAVLTAPEGEVVASRNASQQPPARRGCPVLAGDPDSTERCVDPGGPYGRAAIEASAVWRHNRRILLDLVGCRICHGGPPGGPLGRARGGLFIREVSVPNRLSGVRTLPAPEPDDQATSS